jgi:acetylornithine/succinyldiaminopimelate/putrescine aminotransferase
MKWTGSNPLYLVKTVNNSSTTYLATLSEATALSMQETGSTYKEYTSGQDIGYIYTDFVYTEDLVANAGDSICTMLDKIKSMLGNYEYFYDINGNFVF